MVQDQFHTAEGVSNTRGYDEQASKCSTGSVEDDVKMGSVPSDGKNESVKLLDVNPTHAYHIMGLVNGSNVHFMLDMGASVSLLKYDVWCKVAGDTSLSTWSGHKLVGVEGSTISILGTATIDIFLSRIPVKGDFLITDTLNTQEYLGWISWSGIIASLTLSKRSNTCMGNPLE